MRLQKFLAQQGISSRRKAEEYIEQGLVKVNGETITTLGYKIDPENDRVSFKNRELFGETEQHTYLLLNKPAGYICTASDTHKRKTIFDLLPQEKRLYSIGRLDKETEGLLIVTDDGDLTYKLTHPKYHVEKEYLVICLGSLSNEKKVMLEKGIMLDGKKTAPCKIDVKNAGDSTTLHITIHEGRKRQIRNMFEIIGHKVHYLKRIRIGHLGLANLAIGQYRPLSEKELDKFF